VSHYSEDTAEKSRIFLETVGLVTRSSQLDFVMSSIRIQEFSSALATVCTL